MTNIFNNKKNINNTSSIEQDDVTVNSSLVVPRLTTAERNSLTPVVGNIIYNTDLNEYEVYENGTWERIVTSTGGSGTFVTIANDEVITGKKEFRDLTLFGDDKVPDSLVHLYDENPTLKIESKAGGLSQLLMNGQDENIINMGFNADIRSKTGEGNIDIRSTGDLAYFCRFDATNKLVSIGNSNPTVPKVRLKVFSGGSVNHSLGLPQMDNTGEADYLTTATTSEYNGTIWYNGTTHELRTIVNGTAYDLHHANTTDITHVNTSDASSQLMGINDFNIMTNKAVDKLQYQTLAPPSYNEGLSFYDSNEKSLAYYDDNTNLEHIVNRESYIRVYNNSGQPINKTQIVYITGSQLEGTKYRPTIGLADASDVNKIAVVGIVEQTINNGSYGPILYFGKLDNINTSGFTSGDILYLSDTIPGLLVNTKPANGNFIIECGFVINSDASVGTALIEINESFEPAGEASNLCLPVRKGSPGTLNVGEVVYISGWNNGAGVIEAELADNTSSSSMPAIGIMTGVASNNSTGKLCVSGRFSGYNTNSFNIGDPLYVNTLGTLTNVRPTGSTNLIQVLGTVVRKNPNGEINLINDDLKRLPQLAQNNIWLGDANAHPQPTLNNTVNVDLTSTQNNIAGAKTFTNALTVQHNGSALFDALILENISPTPGLNRSIGMTFKGVDTLNQTIQWSLGVDGDSLNSCMMMYKFPVGGAGDLRYCFGDTYLDFKNSQELRINGNKIIDSNSLGSNILSSSLTSIGNINHNLNINTGFNYQIGGNNVLSNTLLRLNNKDIINEATASLTANVITANLRENISSNNLLKLTNTSLGVEHTSGIDPFINLTRKPGNEQYKILLNSSDQLVVRRDTLAIPGTEIIKFGTIGSDLLQGNYLYNGNITLSNTKLRLNNQDIIDQATNTLSSQILNSSLTSLGILTSLQVDNINLNGNTISTTGNITFGSNIATNININDATSPQVDFTRGANTAVIKMNSTDRIDIDINSTNQVRIDATGNLDLKNSGVYAINGVKVVDQRKTGWATATGTATRTTFDTTSVSLSRLAEAVKALIDDLHQTAGHGLIGT